MDPTSAGLVTGALALSPLATRLLSKVLGPSAELVGDHFADKLSRYLERNRVAVVNRAAEIVSASGRDAHEIPLRTAIPLLEGASRESDPEMQERWAALLASAATARHDAGPVFAAALSQLTPRAAMFLEQLQSSSVANEFADRERGDSDSVPRWGAKPQDVAEVLKWFDGLAPNDPEDEGVAYGEVEEEVDLIVDILIRQALVEREPSLRSTVRGNLTPSLGQEIGVTSFGKAFLEACRARAS